ncbi:RNA polymerase sigma factor [Streptacidiphilus sp. EB129]|uniref:RNA polymerase sigma factor n=1 Tax=Streptacidiphilus sp. EB129 TaxID=3156262 RepID=UPI003511B00E
MGTRVTEEQQKELARLFDSAYARIYRYCMVLTRGQRAIAEDCAQEAFYAVAKSWDTLGPQREARQEAWMRSVCWNKWHDLQRHQMTGDALNSKVVQFYESTPATPEDVVVHRATLRKCLEIIFMMPPARQEVALLRWREELSVKEIAVSLGIAPATVRSHCRTARNQLVEQLGTWLPRVDHLSDMEPTQQRRGA